MPPNSASLQVGLLKRNHLHHRYQMPFAGLLTFLVPPSPTPLANWWLLNIKITVSMTEVVYSLSDLPFPGVFRIRGQSFRCILVNCVAGNCDVFSFLYPFFCIVAGVL
ncbi:unnamed protein product [Protopolystoma xenopodis]|uniref:Uncharacterized protein n=1 Tax=Protopolystoma xenopodis TaxID=117903 RepID=A0A3S4ZWM6_9PLAT|nr:unnamed protein product [Protopolystoma xenopodis]